MWMSFWRSRGSRRPKRVWVLSKSSATPLEVADNIMAPALAVVPDERGVCAGALHAGNETRGIRRSSQAGQGPDQRGDAGAG